MDLLAALRGTKARISYMVVACVLVAFYILQENATVEVVFETDTVLTRDNASHYENRTGYSCAKPNFTHIERSSYNLPKEVQEDNFTIVVLTHNRTQVLLQTLRHYIKMKKVDRVIVLWNNQGVDPPQFMEILNTSVLIITNIIKENKLRLRYQPSPDIKTQAIFNTDDDMLVAEEDVNRAFEVWKLNPYTSVGFYARGVYEPLFGWSKYKYTFDKINDATYSIILVDVAFLHREYFRLFEDTLPEGMARVIDRWNNCEDIAMSFLIANFCKCPSGLHVEPRTEMIHITGKRGGLSGKSSHSRNRGRCISIYSKYFSDMPLKSISCVYH